MAPDRVDGGFDGTRSGPCPEAELEGIDQLPGLPVEATEPCAPVAETWAGLCPFVELPDEGEASS